MRIPYWQSINGSYKYLQHALHQPSPPPPPSNAKQALL